MSRARTPEPPSVDKPADKPADKLTADEARLVKDAGRFDLRALVSRLREMDYSREEILFESSLESGQSSLVQWVRFRQGSMFKSAVITVHLGLLGDAGLLPSYFLQVAERSPHPEQFFDFLRYFDHRLIENLFDALHPEDVIWASGTVLQSFFRMTAPGSPATLRWVVQMFFPELGVRVTRRPFEDPVSLHACRTGTSVLDGSAILGQTFVSDLDGFHVDLITEDEADMRDHDQADIVRGRLRTHVLPLLAPFRLPLVVNLTVLWHRSSAWFDLPGDRQYLGYERLLGATPPNAKPPARAVHRPKRVAEPAGAGRGPSYIPYDRPVAPGDEALTPLPAPEDRKEDPMGVKHTTVMFRGITGAEANSVPL